ncbi:MAG: hypothetical protein MAG794_00600 [Gammaproteobacteria bacterium]|nr:hypothetical protein [Gammaproteobacteria bacterium]
MKMLLAGLLLWSLVHFVPSLLIPVKRVWKNALGSGGYKITFALIVVASVVLMVIGWRQSTPQLLYSLPPAAKTVSILLMVVAFVLLGAANHPSRIKSYLRHPQLTSVVIWSIAHLLINGDSRSLLLFGGLGIWALVEVVLINRREGPWKKPQPPGWKKDLISLMIAVVMLVVVVFIHPYIAGVPVH